MGNGKSLVEVTDRNGHRVRRWKNNGSSNTDRAAGVSRLPKAAASNVLIEKTGEIDGMFMFSHAVIDDENSLQAVLDTNPDIDFVSVRKSGTVWFRHITDAENQEGIEATGLDYHERHKGDLGYGIYVTLDDDDNALDDYIAEMYEDDSELAIYTGSYVGEYTECIYGRGHEGYIVLAGSVPVNDLNEPRLVTAGDLLYG